MAEPDYYERKAHRNAEDMDKVIALVRRWMAVIGRFVDDDGFMEMAIWSWVALLMSMIIVLTWSVL